MPYDYRVTPSRSAQSGPGREIVPRVATRRKRTSYQRRGAVRYIETKAELNELSGELRGAELVAADSEAAGFHRYHDRLCLLQLSTRHETVLVDALAVENLGGLADLFANPEREVVFHDADYDLRLLDRDFGVVVRGLFDTKIAAEFLGEPKLGLANVLEKHVGVTLAKKHQRADWAQRPLPTEMLEYAATDTRHLPELRDALRAALLDRGRLAWAEEEFRRQEATRWEPPADEGTAYLRVKGTRDLAPRQLAALRELYAWREARAEAMDRATFRVMSNSALVGLARHMPSSRAELMKVDSLPHTLARRYGSELLEAIEEARSLPASELPERPRPARRAPDPELDARVDRLKAVRDRRAAELELDRGFLMPRSQLELVARAEPANAEALARMPSIRNWQVEALGAGLLAALRNGGGV